MRENNLISNSKQRLRGEKHYVFMAKVNKIVLSDSNQKKNTINWFNRNINMQRTKNVKIKKRNIRI